MLCLRIANAVNKALALEAARPLIQMPPEQVTLLYLQLLALPAVPQWKDTTSWAETGSRFDNRCTALSVPPAA